MHATESQMRQDLADCYRLFDWMAGVPDPDEVLRRTGRTRADLRQLIEDRGFWMPMVLSTCHGGISREATRVLIARAHGRLSLLHDNLY